MKRDLLKNKLLQFGYSDVMVRKLLQGVSKPTADKMFKLSDEFDIPLDAWRDIKSYLQENDTVHQCTKTNTPKK